ncbi:MerR family transcriptional regulator [Arthrobacter sp. TMN-49]
MSTTTQSVSVPWLSIAELARTTGLTQDTLRWYERQGLFPPVARRTDHRRAYSSSDVARIMLVVKLRRTGMSVANMQRFAELLRDGPETHPERLLLLAEHRAGVLAQLAQIQADLGALERKIAHYEGLIASGLDCEAAAPDPLPGDSDGAKK